MDSNNISPKYGVIGAGSFGIAVANLLAQNGDVLLYVRSEDQKSEINTKHTLKSY